MGFSCKNPVHVTVFQCLKDLQEVGGDGKKPDFFFFMSYDNTSVSGISVKVITVGCHRV